MMRFLLFIGFLSLYSIFYSQPVIDRGYKIKVGDMAPDFSTTLSNNATFNLSQQKGKVVMLQFTASWCGVCRKEMPFIEEEIWQLLKNENFVLIGIDRDEPMEKVLDFIDQTKITYPLALDPDSKIFTLFAHEDAGVTRNVIIDKTGKIVYLTRLFNVDEFDNMKLIINKLISN